MGEDREGYENVMVTNGERAWTTEGKIILLPMYNIFNGTLCIPYERKILCRQ